MDAPDVAEILRSRVGLDPATAGPALLRRAVRARTDALGLSPGDLAGYAALVSRSQDELDALVEEVVVSESWFFRDEQPFPLLADRLARAAEADPGRGPFRILSVPCAGGEEPYSAAIALLDRGLTADRFRVVGVDLSRRALETAARGVYGANAFRTKDLRFRDRYFRRTADGFELSGGVKAAVTFRRGNLADESFLDGVTPFDAVFCRNLLIYLDEPSRRRAFCHLDRLLSGDGLLFLGHAENLGPLGGRYRPAGPSYCFAFERGAPDRGVRTPSLPPPRAVLAITSVGKGPAGRAGGTSADQKKLQPRPPDEAGRPGPLVPPAEAARGDRATGDRTPPADLDEAARLADAGRNDDAARVCEEAMRARGPSAPGLFLLGMIRQAMGRRDEAERCFEKAVYLDPHHDEALLALSAAARRRGDHAAAANYLRRAGLAAERGGGP